MLQPRQAVLLSLLAVSLAAVVPAGASPSDDRVRPGLGYTSAPGGCSFGFLLAGSDGRTYVATAGHCAMKNTETERVWLRGDGPLVTNDQARPVGHFVYAVNDSAFVDFALIRLNTGIRGNPQMCAWGGPTRLLTEPREGLTELHQHGQGSVISDVAPTRTAFARSLPREPYTFVQGPFSPGDSGSAIMTADGAAMGQLVHIGADVLAPDAGGGVVRLEYALQAATRKIGIRFTLRTAPLLPAPLPTATC